MKDITKQTTIAGVKKCVQSLSDRIDRQLGEINERYDGIGRRLNKLSRIEKQENCDHQYLRIEIENDGWIPYKQATCRDCGKVFELGLLRPFKKTIIKLHKTFLKGTIT